MEAAGVTPQKAAPSYKWCGICRKNRPAKDFARHERENKAHLKNVKKGFEWVAEPES